MIKKITHRFKGLPLIFYSSDMELWQMAFESNRRHYKARIIKGKLHNGIISYRINRKWYSKNKLNSLAYLVKEEYDTGMLPHSDMPF